MQNGGEVYANELRCICVHILDVTENILAAVVVLVEPGHHLSRSNQVDRDKRPS